MKATSPEFYVPDVGLTFGGSGLDRAADLRARADATGPEARVLPLWKGKPLLDGAFGASAGLAWLSHGHPALAAAVEALVFLGTSAGAPRFAADISGWTPAEGPSEPRDGFSDATVQVHPDGPAGSGFVELRSCMTRLTPRDAELSATARALLEWHRTHRFCAACGAPTAIAEGGWQRACAACGTRHFPRTDPVVIMAVTRGDDMLVGRSPHWPEGMYSLLAGYVEPGETVEGAVRREVFEEAGIRVGAVEYVVSQPWPFPASLMIACHGAALDAGIRVDPAELADARWVSRERMLDIHAGRDTEMTPARQGAVARFVIDRWLAGRLQAPLPWT